jgi:hypothetical protein
MQPKKARSCGRDTPPGDGERITSLNGSSFFLFSAILVARMRRDMKK